MNRRALLSVAGLAVAPLAGCIGGNARDAVVNTAERSVGESATVVSYAPLPEAERQTAQTAVEEAFYHAGPELPDALRSFGERFPTIDNSYLAYQGTTYGLWIRVLDTIRVDTAPTPGAHPSRGLF